MRQFLQENKGINPSHFYGNGYKIPPATVAKVVKTKIVLTFNKEHKYLLRNHKMAVVG